MLKKTPAYVESRIRFLLGKHGLPRLRTRLYDRSTVFPAGLRALAESGRVGKPVACSVTDDNNWTLLGTHAIAGCCERREAITLLEAVRSIDLAAKHGDRCRAGIKKNLADSGKPVCLEIGDEHGATHEFCFATVSEQCAFWNIIKRLTAPTRQTRPKDT